MSDRFDVMQAFIAARACCCWADPSGRRAVMGRGWPECRLPPTDCSEAAIPQSAHFGSSI